MYFKLKSRAEWHKGSKLNTKEKLRLLSMTLLNKSYFCFLAFCEELAGTKK